MKLAGVVVVYNPEDSIMNNIKSYINNLEKLYVVDNSDNDNSKKFKDKKIEYISNGKNLGIATALNIGAKKAIQDKFKWLLTMDQDSKFNKNGIDEMIEFLEKTKKDKFIQKIINTDFNKIGLITPFHLTKISVLEPEKFGIENYFNAMTSGNIINLDAYKKVAGFKDWLFIDCVDMDFCMNLEIHGFKIIRLNYIKLNHSLGNCIFKKIFGKQIYSLNHNAIRRYYIVRNRHYLSDMYKDTYPIFCKSELKRTSRELIKIWLCEKDKFKKTIYMFRGYLDYKKGKKGKINE